MHSGCRGSEFSCLQKMQEGRLAREVEAQKEDATALVVQAEQVEEPGVGLMEHRKHLSRRLSLVLV